MGLIELVEVDRRNELADYEEVPGLGPALAEVQREARQALKRLGGRRVWVLATPSAVGADQEIAADLVALLSASGVDARLALYRHNDPALDTVVRRLRRMILGDADAPQELEPEDLELYAARGREAGEAMLGHVQPRDILLVQGVAAAPVGAHVRQQRRVLALWRCLQGLDDRTASTRTAWRLLREHLTPYDRGLFNSAAYVPQYFTHRASVVTPGIDPLSDKNRPLSLHQVIDILCSAGLVGSREPMRLPAFGQPARRVSADGVLHEAGELGLLYRPVVSQISRWDNLKGQLPLLQGFVEMKQRLSNGDLEVSDPNACRIIERAHLILAGPEPAAEDEDAQRVFGQLVAHYCGLDVDFQSDISILALSTEQATEHALLVNALQRVSSVLAHNALCEGWGLAVTEAAWKGIPILGSTASGLRLQLRHEIDGILCEAPEDPREVATCLARLLADEPARRRFAASAQRRAHNEFLALTELRCHLRLLSELA